MATGTAADLVASPSGLLILKGAFLLSFQSAARLPLAFAVEDVSDGLAARSAAVLGRVSRGGLRGFMAAGAVADGQGKKVFCRVTTRRLKLGVLRGLRRGFRFLTACSFGGGVLFFGLFVLAAFGLAPRGLPAVEFFSALGILAVALVPAARCEFPSAAAAEAGSGARLSRSSGASPV